MPDTGSPHFLRYPAAAEPPRGNEQLANLAADTHGRLDAVAATVPRGVWLGEKAANTTGIGSTPVDLVSVTFPAVAGRRYRASVFLPAVVGTAATNRFLIELMSGTTRLQRAWVETRQAGTSADLPASLTFLSAATLSGSQTWRVRIATDGFGTSGSVGASSTSPVQLIVDEVLPGAAS